MSSLAPLVRSSRRRVFAGGIALIAGALSCAQEAAAREIEDVTRVARWSLAFKPDPLHAPVTTEKSHP